MEHAHVFYPLIKRASKEIPKIISETYYEALKVEKISPIAFSILIRRTLELLCKDQNAGGNNLKLQLKNLADKNIIPNTLFEMGDTLRNLGNLGAHSSEYNFDYVEIEAMKDFIIAMLEFVYVAPAKIEELRKSIEKKKTTVPNTI